MRVLTVRVAGGRRRHGRGEVTGMLRLGRREFDAHEPVIMAIVNRTPDSFYDQGATFRDEPALARVEQAVAEGAAIIDIGGVKAGPGEEVTRRGGGAAHGRLRRRGAAALPRRGDQRRHLAARGRRGGLRGGRGSAQRRLGRGRPASSRRSPRGTAWGWCAPTRAAPSRAPGRTGSAYDDVMADILRVTVGLAERAVELGVRRDGDHDRPRARLREEHPALAGGDAAARAR